MDGGFAVLTGDFNQFFFGTCAGLKINQFFFGICAGLKKTKKQFFLLSCGSGVASSTFLIIKLKLQAKKGMLHILSRLAKATVIEALSVITVDLFWSPHSVIKSILQVFSCVGLRDCSYTYSTDKRISSSFM